MLYSFTNPQGETVELQYSMKDVPSIGETVLVDGEVMTRVCSEFVIDDAHNRNQFPYLSNSLPRNLAGAKCDAKGRPIITSKKNEREIMARHDYVKT